MQYRLFLTALTCLTVSLVACVPYKEAKSDSETSDYHYKMGVSALDEQNPTAALIEFLLAEEADDRDPKIQSSLAYAYWLKQAHGLAEQHYKNAIKLSDNDPEYYQNLAALYLSVGRYDESIVAFRSQQKIFFSIGQNRLGQESDSLISRNLIILRLNVPIEKLWL